MNPKSRQDKQDDRQEGQDVKLAVMATDIQYIKQEVKGINTQLSANYMSRLEGEALRQRVKLLERVVYSAVGLILVVVLTAIVTDRIK